MNFRGFMGFAGKAWQYARPTINFAKAPRKLNTSQLGKLTGMYMCPSFRETLLQLVRVSGVPSNVQLANLRERLLQKLCETPVTDSLLTDEGKEVVVRGVPQTRSLLQCVMSNIEVGCLSPMSIIHQNQITLKRIQAC